MTKQVKLSLKEVREKTKLSQDEYAKQLGLKYGTYVKKELYLRGLTAAELIAISDFSGVPIRQIALENEQLYFFTLFVQLECTEVM